jgi:glycosyltransferase involved in cell wall biosynthesis
VQNHHKVPEQDSTQILNPDSHRRSVSVIIPVLDEEASIGRVMAAIPRAIVDDIVVVDGGSRDRTVEVARAAGARVVVERRFGYGRACATGVRTVSSGILVFLDGDGSDDGSAITRVVAPLLQDEADLVLGVRATTWNGRVPVCARIGNSVAAAIVTLLWHQRVTDLPSLKAVRRRDLLSLEMTEDTYGWTTELIVKAARRRLRILEIPVVYSPRVGGVSKVSGNVGASAKAGFVILRVLARHCIGHG